MLGARPCPGKQPSPLASRRQPPLCAPATDVAKKASRTELKRENLENNGVCPPLGRSWELGRARLLFRGPRLLPEHPRVPPAAAFLGDAGPRGTRQRFGDGTRWNSGHRRAAAAGRARDWEYWGAGRGGEGGAGEPRGSKKKPLYSSAMSKVRIITIYSDKNRISFHINTTTTTTKTNPRNADSVLLPPVTYRNALCTVTAAR